MPETTIAYVKQLRELARSRRKEAERLSAIIAETYAEARRIDALADGMEYQDA